MKNISKLNRGKLYSVRGLIQEKSILASGSVEYLFFSSLAFLAALREIFSLINGIPRKAAENAKKDEVNRSFWQTEPPSCLTMKREGGRDAAFWPASSARCANKLVSA